MHKRFQTSDEVQLRSKQSTTIEFKNGTIGLFRNVGKQLLKICCVNTAEERKPQEKSNGDWKDDIKMDAKEIRYCGTDWMTTAQDFLKYFVDRASLYKFLEITNLTHFFMYLFIACLYMFRASQRSSSGDRIVLIHHLV